MLEFGVNLNKPVVLRYPRGGEDKEIKFEKHEKIELGKAEILKEFDINEDKEKITIIAIGKMVAKAVKLAKQYEENGYNVQVINARFIKPFDNDTIIKSLKISKQVITLEDGTIINGLGTIVKEIIAENNIGIDIKTFAYPDQFIKHGTVDELESDYFPV